MKSEKQKGDSSDAKHAIGMTEPETKDEYDELQLLEKETLKEAYRTSMTLDLLKEKDASTKLVLSEGEGLSITKPVSRNQDYSFNDWLKVVSGKTPESSKEDPSALFRATRKVKTGIIDNYILEETAKSAPKSKTGFYSAGVMAKKSIQDDETFITETLARIYLKQGNLPKALRAYEILVMKYPEKIHIFAPLLEKIKKIIDNRQ